MSRNASDTPYAYAIKSIEKACLLMDFLGVHPEGASITVISQHLGLYKSSVHRLLNTLIQQGYVEQTTDSHYKLGYRLLYLGMQLLSSIDLRREAAPFLTDLAHETHEVVHLALMDNGEIVYIDKQESENAIRMHSQVGQRVPIHATGLGKVILAHLPPEAALHILYTYGTPALTPATLTEPDQFLSVFETIRHHGFAVDVEENQPGVCCVAAPIFNHEGRVVAALSVSGPSTRLDTEARIQIVPQVRRAAKNISQRLGARG